MFIEVDSSPEVVQADRIGARMTTRERYLERLSVAALNALMAVDLDAFNELVKRVESWT